MVRAGPTFPFRVGCSLRAVILVGNGLSNIGRGCQSEDLIENATLWKLDLVCVKRPDLVVAGFAAGDSGSQPPCPHAPTPGRPLAWLTEPQALPALVPVTLCPALRLSPAVSCRHILISEESCGWRWARPSLECLPGIFLFFFEKKGQHSRLVPVLALGRLGIGTAFSLKAVVLSVGAGSHS